MASDGSKGQETIPNPQVQQKRQKHTRASVGKGGRRRENDESKQKWQKIGRAEVSNKELCWGCEKPVTKGNDRSDTRETQKPTDA